MTLRCMDEDEDDLESEYEGGEADLIGAVTLFALEHISLRFHSPQKTFFQKYKKKRNYFFGHFFIWAWSINLLISTQFR